MLFQAYFWLLYNGSQLLILPLLSQKLKMPNMTIASLSSVSRAAYFGILAIAPLGEHVGGAVARKAQVRVHLRCNVD